MHEGNSLQHLSQQVRARTIRYLTEAPPEMLLWAPSGLQNHTLWHAGHALWLGDVLCIEPATGKSELPQGWALRFGMKGTDPSKQTDWPPRREVIDLLRAQGERIFALLGTLTDQQLNSIPRAGGTGDTLVAWIVHGFHDEAIHQGEMKLLGKLWRTRPGT